MRQNEDNRRRKCRMPAKRNCLRGLLVFGLLLLMASCRYAVPDFTNETPDKRTQDSLRYLYERHYTWDANLVLHADSIRLMTLPLKEGYDTLYRGDRVVVAEFDVHPNDTIDSIWVKLAHSQEVQGWLRECEMKEAFMPADSLSQAIHLFSNTHMPYFIAICALFVAFWLARVLRRKPSRQIGFAGIDSVYPLLLCLLMAGCATLYETMQVFAPDTWEHFYYNPTLSPLQVPPVLALFLSGFWLFLVTLVATIDVLFRRLPFMQAVFYLLGVSVACIFCYFFFILTTPIYIGYLFLLAFAAVFIHCLYRSLHTSRYRCGQCGEVLPHKGVCPHCGAVNE